MVLGYGRHVDSMQMGLERVRGKNDSSRRQEGVGDGKRDPRPMWTQRSDGGEVRVFTTGYGDNPLAGSSLPCRFHVHNPSPMVGGYGYSDSQTPAL